MMEKVSMEMEVSVTQKAEVSDLTELEEGVELLRKNITYLEDYAHKLTSHLGIDILDSQVESESKLREGRIGALINEIQRLNERTSNKDMTLKVSLSHVERIIKDDSIGKVEKTI